MPPHALLAILRPCGIRFAVAHHLLLLGALIHFLAALALALTLLHTRPHAPCSSTFVHARPFFLRVHLHHSSLHRSPFTTHHSPLTTVTLAQIYAPIDGSAQAFHRTLYLFCCRECSTFKLLRAQLPEDNKYYRTAPLPAGEDEDDEDDEDDGIAAFRRASFVSADASPTLAHSVRADCRVPSALAVHAVRVQRAVAVLAVQARAVLLQDAPAPRLERRARGGVYVPSTVR